MSTTERPTLERRRYALVLAAGKSTRFRSEKPKVLHDLCGKPIIQHVVDKLVALGVERLFVVIGHGSEEVKRVLDGYPVKFVVQEPQLGTGHAAMMAAPHLEGLAGNVLVVYGDAPMMSSVTLQRLFEAQEGQNADEVILTVKTQNPYGYGRILRDEQDHPYDIVEEKDATPEQKRIPQINAGFICCKISSLLGALPRIKPNNQAGEYYLTDLLKILKSAGGRVAAVEAESFTEIAGINTREELAAAASAMRAEINRKWMLEGVTLIDPERTYIDAGVHIEPDTTIYPGVVLEGNTRLGRGCTIRGFCQLRDAVIDENVTVDHCSVIRDTTIGRDSSIGPFAHIREHSVVGTDARIGNFVEVKKCVIGDETKAAHLAYLGDATIGADVNIGAGTITCNYDGVKKNRTVIEDGAFIGSDSQLIAPVTVRRGAYVAAGSSITDDIPEFSLAIARGRQVNKEGWAVEIVRQREERKKRKAAEKAEAKKV